MTTATTATVVATSAAATAAVVVPAGQESVFVWLNTFFHSMQFQELWVFLLVGFVGIFVHYAKKRLGQEIEGSFFKYLVGDHPASTITAISTFIGTAVTYVFSGTIESASWSAIIGLAFTTGYAVDSALNKSSKPEFTSK